MTTVVVRKCGACQREIPGQLDEFPAVLALHGEAQPTPNRWPTRRLRDN